MKYALISDIHGNYPALKAVLRDAEKNDVQKYLFLGDYIEDLPWPNEVVDTIRELKSAVVIRGNKEDYLVDIDKQEEGAAKYEQMSPMYWNYSELTPDNLKYLLSLPKNVEVVDDSGEVIRLSHSSPNFYRTPRIEAFHSSCYFERMNASPFTHVEYLQYARESVLGNMEIMTELEAFGKGVSAFGHNHLQWHMFLGDTLHVNPGSCGVPLDFNTDAPYSIIEYTGNRWTVTELRVPYDVGYAIDNLKSSSLYEDAKVWSDLIIESLTYAEERLAFFLHYVWKLNVANSPDSLSWPVSNEIWRLATKQWPENKHLTLKK